MTDETASTTVFSTEDIAESMASAILERVEDSATGSSALVNEEVRSNEYFHFLLAAIWHCCSREFAAIK